MDNDTDQYFTYEGRLASFKATYKRRASTSRGTKTIKWPHPQISPESLAHAGWYYAPSPDHPDNVLCFLCSKGLDGWEKGDDPLREHVAHAPQCGWAIVAAIEAEMPEFLSEDPKGRKMTAARRSTFAGKWPHDSKKGWKCKTKQLVDAGWKYTPTPESDDMATCTYCHLALDAWEPNDQPMKEHSNRSPNCLFFTYVNPEPEPKKTTRGRGARTSKASRTSVQSAGMSTFISEGPSTLDAAPEHDESVVTTASRRGARTKKAPAAKTTRKTRAKKEEVAEPEEPEEPEIPAELEDLPPAAPPPAPAPKTRRGRKRTSDAVEDSVLINAEAPAPKKRATRGRTTRASVAANASSVLDTTMETTDVDMTEGETTITTTATGRKPAARKAKGRASSAKPAVRRSSRTSVRSRASNASLRGASADIDDEIPDDAELERRLEEDLERMLTDDEDDLVLDSDSERKRKTRKAVKKAPAPKKQEQAPEQSDYAMFEPEPAIPDEAVVQAELDVLEAEEREKENQMEAAQEEKLVVPKKGRKAAPRKASRQTKKKAPPVREPTPEPEPELAEPEPEPEPMVEDESMVDPEPMVEDMSIVEPGPGAEVPQSPELEPESAGTSIYEDAVEPEPAPAQEPDMPQTSVVSRGTVVRGGSTEDELQAQQPVKRGRARPPKKRGSRGRSSATSAARNSSLLERPAAVPVAAPITEPEPKQDEEGEEEEEEEIHDSIEVSRVGTPEPAADRTIERHEPEEEEEVNPEPEMMIIDTSPVRPVYSMTSTSPVRPLTSSSALALIDARAATPEAHSSSPRVSTAPGPPRDGVLSPSQSPQSSDAENQPPSSKPDSSFASSSRGRPPLIPVVLPSASSPNTILSSPTKKTLVAGVKSSSPWDPVNIELVLRSPGRDTHTSSGDEEDAHGGGDKEEALGMGGLLRKGAELTSPERRMTVEEWIYFNAERAEEKLRRECESLVGRFEGEGMRAMRALEGLVVE